MRVIEMSGTSEVMYDRKAFQDLVSRTFKRLEGKAKTVIDSSVADSTQREAAKSLVEQLIWGEFDFFTEVLRNVELKMVEAKAAKA